MMSWVRTATSMISFGFIIYKFFSELNKEQEKNQLLSARAFGMIMIGFGLIALLLAQVQHQKAMKQLKKNYPATQKSISSILSILILVFGLFLFLAALFRE